MRKVLRRSQGVQTRAQSKREPKYVTGKAPSLFKLAQQLDKKRKRRRGIRQQEVMKSEVSQEIIGQSLEKESKKNPRWRDTAPPTIERPSRAKKAVERFGFPLVKYLNGSEEVQIMKGSGMPLKDIPNIAYKLGKISRTDNFLVLLHTLLYGKSAKVNLLKPNVLSFSGYSFVDDKDEEKKIKGRLEQLTKDNLFQLIDLLDIKLPKSTSKREELVKEGLKFLLAPKITKSTSPQNQDQEDEDLIEEPDKNLEKEAEGIKAAGFYRRRAVHGVAGQRKNEVTEDPYSEGDREELENANESSREIRRKNAQDRVFEYEEQKRVKKPSGKRERRSKNAQDKSTESNHEKLSNEVMLKKERRSKNALDKGMQEEVSRKKRKSMPKKRTSEGWRLSKKVKKLADLDKEKEEERIMIEKMKETDEAVENEELLEEEEAPEERTYVHVKDDRNDTEPDIPKENVASESPAVVSNDEERVKADGPGDFPVQASGRSNDETAGFKKDLLENSEVSKSDSLPEGEDRTLALDSIPEEHLLTSTAQNHSQENEEAFVKFLEENFELNVKPLV